MARVWRDLTNSFDVCLKHRDNISKENGRQRTAQLLQQNSTTRPSSGRFTARISEVLLKFLHRVAQRLPKSMSDIFILDVG